MSPLSILQKWVQWETCLKSSTELGSHALLSPLEIPHCHYSHLSLSWDFKHFIHLILGEVTAPKRQHGCSHNPILSPDLSSLEVVPESGEESYLTSVAHVGKTDCWAFHSKKRKVLHKSSHMFIWEKLKKFSCWCHFWKNKYFLLQFAYRQWWVLAF